MKFWRIVSVVIAVSATLSAAQAGNPVRIAINGNFPPFVVMENGQPRGPLIDVLTAAAQRSNLSIIFVPVTLDQWQAALEEGRAEGFYPMGVSPALSEKYMFSASVASSGGALFVRSPDPTPAGLEALVNKVVVTPSVGPLAGYIARNAPQVKLSVTKDYEESLAKLISGEADAAALNLQVGSKLAAQLYPGKITIADRYFWEIPLAVAFRRQADGANLHKLNEGIAAIRRDGTIDKLMPPVASITR